MKIIIDRKELLKAIESVMVVSRSRSLNDLECTIKFIVEGGRVVLHGFHPVSMICVPVNAETEGFAEFGVINKKIQAMLSELNTESVTISLEEDNTQFIKIESGEGCFSISTEDIRAFPLPAELSGSKSITLDSQLLSKALSCAHPIAARNSDKGEMLTCVLLDIGDQINVVATDGFRIVRSTINGHPGIHHKELIISEAAKQLSKLCANCSDEIDIVFNLEKQTMNVITDMFSLTIRTHPDIEQYPDYHRIMPNGFTTEVETTTAAMQSSIRKMRIVADLVGGAIVSIDTGASVMRFSQVGLQTHHGKSEKADDEFQVRTVKGNSSECKLNIDYVSAALNNSVDSNIVAGMAGNPFMIISQSDNLRVEHVIMPQNG